MFHISAQEEFGLRFLLHLARAGKGQEVALSQIAREEGVSLQYVRKIFGILKRKGLVVASKGALGGYALVCEAEQMQLKTIFAALKTQDKSFSCGDFSGKLAVCANYTNCSVRSLMRFLEGKLHLLLSEIRLSDLLQEERDMSQQLSEQFPLSPAPVAETR